MTSTDRWGVPSGATGDAAGGRLDDAVLELCRMTGQPSLILDGLQADAPDWAMPQVASAYLDLYAQTLDGNRSAGTRLDGVGDDARCDRERAHLDAARRWQTGRPAAALDTLDRWLADWPRDLLALRIAQDLAFFLGDQEALAGIPARALPSWSTGEAERGLVAGMVAFGIEEQGRYGEAEHLATEALDANPGDPWSVHALAHVHEMQGRGAEGAATLRSSAPRWSPSFFASHNWWHLALFCIELDDMAGAVELLHGPIDATPPDVWFEIVNQVSLRWRLALLGTEVPPGPALVDVLVARTDEHLSVFNDLHAVAGLALAGRPEGVERVLAGYRSVDGPAAGGADGGLLLRGVAEFAAGRYDEAARCLGSARETAVAIGGSNAQRDLVDQTLLVALVRSGGSTARIAELVATHPTRWSATTTDLLLASG
jgi:hypothetical protein